MLEEFTAPGTIITDHVHVDVTSMAYPAELEDVLSPELMVEARDEIRQWDGYAPTKLHSLDALASELTWQAFNIRTKVRALVWAVLRPWAVPMRF